MAGARKQSKQSKQAQQAESTTTPAPAETPVVEAGDAAARRRLARFTRGLRRDKATYDLVHGVVTHLATVTGQSFESLWSSVTERDEKHFQRHFRKQRREQDPFRDIKNAIPAYSFFTKEHNSKLKAQHPDKSFGEISKMVGEQWNSLSDKQKAKYNKMAEEDKARYQREVEERSRTLASSTDVAPAVEEEPAPEPAQAPAKSSGRAKRGARRQ